MIHLAYNAVTAYLKNAPREALLEVHRLLSYNVKGAEHMAAFKSGKWGGKSSFLNYDKASFPAGFVDFVSRGLKRAGFEVLLVSKPLPEPLGPEYPEVDSFGYSERYDYQPATVQKLLQHGQCIAQVATGGGKSRICRMAYKRINRPTLFLTTRGILMYQMHDAVVNMGEEVAILGDGEWGIPYTRPNGTRGRRLTKFCVGMVQTLAPRLENKNEKDEIEALRTRRMNSLAKKITARREQLKAAKLKPHQIGKEMDAFVHRESEAMAITKDDLADIKAKITQHNALKKETVEMLSKFELVIAEEAHELSGTGFFDVMAACTNATYRLALTATPFMKDDEEANFRLLASCGPIAIRISEKLLIDRGILAKPYFKFLKLSEDHKPKKLYRSTAWQQAYTIGVVNNEYRNKLLSVEVLRGMRYGLNALILVQHKAHGHILKEMLTKAGARCDFIDGDSDQRERQACLNALGSGDLDVLIGSTILDVGVDVPSIGMIVLAGGGKAEVSLRQRIGRGLREKKGSLPNIALIIDVYDEHNNHLKGHSAERQAIIKETEGFRENICSDFDFVALGLERKAA